MTPTQTQLESSEMEFIKLRIIQLCVTVSRGRKRYVYKSAADKVLNKLFGVKGLASKIMECRSYSSMTTLMSNVDTDALFNILRLSDAYTMLAKIIKLKYDLDAGRCDPKHERDYRKALSHMIDLFDIHTNMVEHQHDDVFRFAKGYKDSMNRRNRDRRIGDDDYGYGIRNLFDDDDEDCLFDSINVNLFDDDVDHIGGIEGRDEYEIFMSQRKTKKASSMKDEDSDVMDDSFARIANTIMDRLDDIESRIDRSNPTTESYAQTAPQAPVMGYVADTGIQILSQKMDSMSDHINGRISNLESATKDAFNGVNKDINNVYRNLNSIANRIQQPAPVKMTGSTTSVTSGQFYRSSENNVSEDIIDCNIDGAIK